MTINARKFTPTFMDGEVTVNIERGYIHLWLNSVVTIGNVIRTNKTGARSWREARGVY